MAVALLGTGRFLTVRLGFIQLCKLGHGFVVTSGIYDDPEEPSDDSHFQALSTALSATVGIGNIAGVALAIHWGGPGAMFQVWMTALVGMAIKYAEVTLGAGDVSYVVETEPGRFHRTSEASEIRVEDGLQLATAAAAVRVAWHEVPLERLFADRELDRAFTGVVDSGRKLAVTADGTTATSLWGLAAESGAPLCMLAFEQGLPGTWGRFIVVLSVFLFAISTAISWSYYGDRCANYLFGRGLVFPYKIAYVAIHFVGSVLTLSVAWTLGDVFLEIVILPNLLALILLSPKVSEPTRSYFQRKPWIENREVHRRAVARQKASRQ